MKNPFIALVTDFGGDDFFVASLKAVISRINPSVITIDITHQVPSFDILRGSFILLSCYKYFPSKTIFLVIIDPGVGSSRKILLVETRNHFFIAPDNGVLSLVLESEEVLQMRKITNKKFFLERRSKTFEGRDKMAPAAAWLSKGIAPEEFGPLVRDFKKLENLKAQWIKDGIAGAIVYKDKFGNLITNIHVKMVNQLLEKSKKNKLVLLVKNKEVESYVENYSQGKRGEVIFLVGSLGYIEIASRETSVSEKIKAQPGDEVKIVCR
ncbi:MAG: S-adenosyl-l-methionine hydroxide adenosyltransferase family protein [Candidatus Aminicenantaceae bacterium]